MTSDPFDDPRVQGIINGIARHVGCDPSELVVTLRGERRGGDGGQDTTTAVPGLPVSGEGEQS